MSRALTSRHSRFGRGPLKSGGFSDGLRLASGLLVLVCAQSCLVPQSVDPIPVAAHAVPYFDQESIPDYLLAPVLQLYQQGSADATHTPPCHCEIEIPALFVHEDDPTVELQVRWFIDYDKAVQRSEAPWPGSTVTLAPNFNDPTYTQRPINKFDFDAQAADINTNGVHVLLVVVGETSGFDDSLSAALPNRSMKAGFTAAELEFPIFVDVAQDPSRPQCPSQQPSLRVCQ
jgi:hypothetical protein